MLSTMFSGLNKAVGERPWRAITKGCVKYPHSSSDSSTLDPSLPLHNIHSFDVPHSSRQADYGHFNGPSAFQQQLNVYPHSLQKDNKIFTHPISSLELQSQPWSDHVHTEVEESCSDSDDDKEGIQTHPNKFPVEIEYHGNKYCHYKRQKLRSGEKFKRRIINKNNPQTLQPEVELQQVKFYQKHLVRICRCGEYTQMDGALQHGRNNDCNGYEIHYNQKCRWKAYDDFRTGKRVLIRLCKCYKPQI